MAMRNGLNSESKRGHNTPYISPAWMIIHCLIVAMVLLCSPARAQNQPQKSTGRTRNVLVINSYRPTYNWARQTTKGIEDTFTQYKDRVEIKIEYMNSRHFTDEKHYKNLYELYKHKASSRKYDVIIAADDNALRFVLQHRDELYPNVPVVFCGIQEIDNLVPKGYDFLTGVYEVQVFEPTLQLVLKLHPSAERLVIVSDGTVDRTPFLHEQRLKIMQKYQDRVQCVTHFLYELNADELLTIIGGLGLNSILIFTGSFKDPEGNLYSFQEKADNIKQQCKAPIYTMTEAWLGLGPVVGGHIVTGFLQGQAAAIIAMRILDGESPANIPPLPQTPSKFMFDYIQLQNFSIPLSSLPEGSTIINMPKSFYQENKKLVWATVTAIVVLIAAIVTLSANILLKREAKKALEESQRQQSAILNTIPDIAWLKDKNSKYIAVNEQFAKFCGTKPENVVGKTDFDIWPEDLANKYVTDDKEVIQSGKRKRLEEQLELKQGKRIWLDTIKTPIFNDQGQLVGTSGIARDITERQMLDQKLREAEGKYRTLVEQIPAVTYIAALDEASTTIYISPQIETILGFKPQDYQADPDIWRKQLHPDDRQRVLEEIRKTHQKGQPFSCEYRMFAKDGSVIWLRDEAVIVKDTSNKPLFLQGVMLDITDRKKAEQELRESEQRFRAIFDGAIDGMLLADPETKKIFAANQACCKMLGYTNEELANLSVKDIHPKDQLGHVIRDFEKQLAGEFELAENMPVKRKDGSIFYANISLATLTLSGKIYLMGVFRDITERKQAQEQLELYREKMTRAERLASLGTISATLSHELNQPLTAIRLFIENSLAEMDKTQQPPGITDALKDSLKEIETAASIVDRFRNFARQSLEKDICQVDIKTVAQRIFALLNEAAQRANVSLTCKDMDNLPPVYSNEKDLEQVLFALIENAIQAADGKKRKCLTISSNVKNGMLELKFADNCKGIPPENLDKIFEPFFTTKPIGEGTGLGLCIVQRILSGYGGKIRVDSKTGKGSTFYATLPIHQNNIG